MKRFDLLVTDLDGTLWDGDEAVHGETLGLLRDVVDVGLPWLVATGRRRRSAERGLAAVGFAPPAVVLGGALGLDLGTGAEFHRRTFTPEQATAVLEIFLRHGIEPCVYVADDDTCEVLVGEAPATHYRHLQALGSWAHRCELATGVRERPVLNFGVIGGNPETLRTLAGDLAEVASPVVNHDLVFEGSTLMVAPGTVSKWDGILAFCAREGLDPSRVIAVGDGANDVEMLSSCALGVVVADGAPEALDRADVVIPQAAAGGWSELRSLL